MALPVAGGVALVDPWFALVIVAGAKVALPVVAGAALVDPWIALVMAAGAGDGTATRIAGLEARGLTATAMAGVLRPVAAAGAAFYETMMSGFRIVKI